MGGKTKGMIFTSQSAGYHALLCSKRGYHHADIIYITKNNPQPMKDTIRGTRINFNPINILKINWYVIEDLFPLFLSHHPSCKRYDEDVFKMGRLRLCIGCTMMYPTFVIASLFILALYREGYIRWDLLLMLTPLFYSTLVLKYLGMTSLKPIKIVVATFLGAGLACFLWGGILMPHGVFIVLPLFILINLVVAYSAKYRGRSLFKNCNRCAYRMNWARCPGLRDNIRKLDQDGLDASSQFKYKFEPP